MATASYSRFMQRGPLSLGEMEAELVCVELTRRLVYAFDDLWQLQHDNFQDRSAEEAALQRVALQTSIASTALDIVYALTGKYLDMADLARAPSEPPGAARQGSVGHCPSPLPR